MKCGKGGGGQNAQLRRPTSSRVLQRNRIGGNEIQFVADFFREFLKMGANPIAYPSKLL
jgi:hypothetical protein